MENETCDPPKQAEQQTEKPKERDTFSSWSMLLSIIFLAGFLSGVLTYKYIIAEKPINTYQTKCQEQCKAVGLNLYAINFNETQAKTLCACISKHGWITEAELGLDLTSCCDGDNCFKYCGEMVQPNAQD